MCKPIAGHSWWITIVAGLVLTGIGWVYGGGKKSQEINEISNRMERCEKKIDKIDEFAGRVDRSVTRLEAIIDRMDKEQARRDERD